MEKTLTITIRLDERLTAAVDRHVKRLQKRADHGVRITTTAALRNMLEAGAAAVLMEGLER